MLTSARLLPAITSRSWLSCSDDACPSAPNTLLMSLGSVDIFSHFAHASVIWVPPDARTAPV
jgi:hypothetical protein